jgi:serine-type D-Ala-D-Ala carboxypeptidase/endopeptidase
MPSKDSLQRVVRERVEAGRSNGLIVGVIRADGTRDVAAAGLERAGKPVDGQTLFEIGSITKVFTGILLADMVKRGEVRLDQPVSELLPAEVKVPTRNGRQITLADLASQTSGLPRLPSNIRPADNTNPYADYTVAQLYAFLSQHQLARDPGAQYEYSNLGVGLLGHALALRAGKAYEALVRERILAPLGMHSTGITLTSAMRARMSEGHDASGRVVPLWDLPTLAGAGALRSSLDDMMRFAAAALAPPATPVGRAIAESQAARFRVNQVLSLGLNWHRVVLEGDTIIWHNGGTGGFRTYIGINRRARTAVVLLNNSSQDHEDIARHMLVPKVPLVAFVARREITLDPAVLDGYPGIYRLSPQLALTVSREGTALVVQPTGQPKFPLFAEARDRFFLKAVDAQLEFTRDSTGTVSSVTLVQNGNRMPGPRQREPADSSLLRVDSAWARSYAMNDTATALQLMSDDFFMTTTTGTVKNKAAELADVRPAPNLRMKYFRTEQVRTRTYGDAGVVTGVAEWSFEMGGSTSTLRRRYTALYSRGGRLGWLLVALHMGRAD